MFWQVLRFELRYHSRQPLIYIVTLFFFILAFGATSSESISVGGGTGNLNLNAPFVVMQTLAGFSIIGMFAIVAFAANPVLRDFENRTAEFFFTTRVDKFSYLFGRFTGSFFICYVTVLGAVLGVFLGEFMPWLDQERIGETSFAAYWFANWSILLPNVFIMASMFFCVATLTRSVFGSYLVAVAMIVLFSVISSFDDPDTIRMTSAADPFGLIAFFTETRYWTVFDRNTLIPDFSGKLLINRSLWVGGGVLFLLFAYWRFPFAMQTARRRRRKKSKPTAQSTVRLSGYSSVTPRFSGVTLWQQFRSQVLVELKTTLRGIPFIVLLGFAILNLTGGSLGMIGEMFGTPVYPVTGIMIRAIQSTYVMMILFVIIYYSGELVHRDRALKLSGIIDATPWPNWIMVASKIIALMMVVVAMLLVSIATAIVIQIFHSYYNFELNTYLFGLLILAGIPFYLAGVLAITVQSVMQNKYLGMLVMTLYMISLLALPGAGFPHQLYRYTVDIGPYSDINGFGHFLTPYAWFTVYWSLFALMLAVVAHLTWNRGEESSLKIRWQLVKERFTPPVLTVLSITGLAFVVTGGYIFYNTNILNDYATREALEERRAEYEKKYKQYQYMPQPQVTDVQVDVDIHPADRDVFARGTYRLENSNDSAVSDLHVLLFPYITINSLEIDGAELVESDPDLGFHLYRFQEPIQPGDSTELRFDVAWINDGFVNHGSTTRVVYNGTFINNTEFLPQIGYQSQVELTDNNIRRKYDLEAVKRAPDIDDASALQRAYFGNWQRVNFDTTVSTAADQIALAPGYLERQWTENGRRYFRYKMDQPIWNFYAYLSQDYQVKKDIWEDGENRVDIEVYYHHDFNVDTMVRAVQESLNYFTRNFSPYQYRQFRILEFPAYATFAQSFPNTVPFSEAIGFIADLRDPERIDYVYYVTAHELAHQWWGHQVMSADTQGAAVIVETLSQYSALMVMERAYGADHMHRFLKYELDRYLTGRGGELIEELPLMLVENQGYIHYRKGSVALYALKDAIGDAAINRALKRLIEDYGFKGAPYPTAKTLVSYLREESPDEYQQLITDLFEKIILYDLKATEVAMTELDDGRYQVDLTVSARKFEAKGSGEETEIPISGQFDIAVLGEEQGESKIPEVLFLERVDLKEKQQSFKIVVDSKPVKAGIDPYFKQIDRVPTDNLKTI